MSIGDLPVTTKPSFSFEIFPPKGSTDLTGTLTTIDALADLKPDFISVTYGAGGTSRENTVEISSAIENKHNTPALAHLTCIGSSKENIDVILTRLKAMGIKNILAMRGDLVEGEPLGDFKHASDLITYIKTKYDFNIFGACYPEKHTEAYSLEEDLNHLKFKVDQGVDALITQLFFDNNAFYSFREKAREKNINVPIIAGIMPITSAKQISRMVTMCGATLPIGMQKMIQVYGNNPVAMKDAGIAYATSQIIDLLANGVDGIHIYTMNQIDIAQRIVANIKEILCTLRDERVSDKKLIV